MLHTHHSEEVYFFYTPQIEASHRLPNMCVGQNMQLFCRLT